MALAVYYTQTAKDTLNASYRFIESRFGSAAADKFILKTEHTIKLISANPFMFKASSFDQNVRIGFVTKHTAIFYQVVEQNINLLYFWDNRQETLIKS